MALLLNNFNKQKSDIFDMKLKPVISEEELRFKKNMSEQEPTRTRTLVDIELEADSDLEDEDEIVQKDVIHQVEMQHGNYE